MLTAHAKWTMRMEPKIFVYLFQPQDADVLLPVAQEFSRRGVPVKIYMGGALHKRSPRCLNRVQELGFQCVIDPSPYLLALAISKYICSWPFLKGRGKALLCIETSAPPHNLGRRLALQAKASGLRVYTLQHGLENVGINYADELNPPGRVSFVSDRIFVWNKKNVSDWACQREKFLDLGRVSLPHSAQSPFADAGERIRVGVFENLHWKRFNESYRQLFFQSLRALLVRFPEVEFILKPHVMSGWSSEFRPQLEDFKNLVWADSGGEILKNCTAPMMLPYMRACITTPSTVALDAAQLGVPVAIFGASESLPAYEPLAHLQNEGDWESFILEVLEKPLVHLSLAKEFVDLKLSSQNSESKIVDCILNDLKGNEVIEKTPREAPISSVSQQKF